MTQEQKAKYEQLQSELGQALGNYLDFLYELQRDELKLADKYYELVKTNPSESNINELLAHERNAKTIQDTKTKMNRIDFSIKLLA